MTLAAASIKSALEAAQRKRRSGDLEYQKQLSSAYRTAMTAVQVETYRFADWVTQQKAAGAPVSPSWLMRQERYLSLQSQIGKALIGFGEEADRITRDITRAGAYQGLQGLAEETYRAAGGTGPVGEIGGFGSATWARLDQRAFDAAVALLEQNRSPLKQLLEGVSTEALSNFRQQMYTGIAMGRNPLKIAQRFYANTKSMALGRAQTIARTEWHRATRVARSEAFTQSDVVRSWIWRAAMDRSTCGVCYLMHGTEHPTTEPLQGHPNCRCVMIPKTKEWHELGLPGVPNTKPPIEPGASQFRRLPEKDQRRLIGPTRLEMFKSGQMKLRDMTWSRPNAQWGPMRQFKPLPPSAIRGSGQKATAGMVWDHIDFSKLPIGHTVYSAIAEITKRMTWLNHEMSWTSRYQGSFYVDFNRWARGLPSRYGQPRTASTLAEYRTAMDTFKQMFQKVTPTDKDMMVYRGMRTGTQPIRVGGSFVDNAPMSTTTSAMISDGFLGDPAQSAYLRLLLPKGSKAVTADEVSGFGGMGEAEVLIAPGSRVRIIRQIQDKYVGNTPYPQFEGVIETP